MRSIGYGEAPGGGRLRHARYPPDAADSHRSRCMASAFLTLRTAAEGRLSLPFLRGGSGPNVWRAAIAGAKRLRDFIRRRRAD